MKKLLYVFAALLICFGPRHDSHAAAHRQQVAAITHGAASGQKALACRACGGSAVTSSQRDVALPPPTLKGTYDVARLLRQRRSVRAFAPTPLTLTQLGQLLWAAQGITANGQLRTAPSAGALYPLELYVVAGHVAGLLAGTYHYDPQAHRLVRVGSGDQRGAVAAAAVQQLWLAKAPAIVVFGAVYARTAAKYGSRAHRFVQIELGHAAQNLFLQAEDLGLGTVDVGSFDDQELARVLRLPADVAPLLLMPVGTPN